MTTTFRALLALLCMSAGGAAAETFCNTTALQIPGSGTIGKASTYPSVIGVSRVGGTIGTMSVDLLGVNHTYPQDLDILLVGPGGQNLILQSDAGTGVDAVDLHYRLRDGAATAMSNSATLVSGQYRPGDFPGTDTFPAPAPASPYAHPAPGGSATFASVFGGTAPNGNWSLYVLDDSDGDAGSLSGGWCINFGDASPLRISEWRDYGATGVADEYIELTNLSANPTLVAAVDGSAGFAIAASDGVARCVIPNGTTVPGMGHYLCANTGYSLANYPGASASTAPDQTYTTDIANNAGVALFSTATPANFTLAQRVDAVGTTAEANSVYRRGTGVAPLTGAAFNVTYFRDACGRAGSIVATGPCPTGGLVQDSGNNATDFVYADPDGQSLGAGQRLGAPGPQNLASPRSGVGDLGNARLDACADIRSAPNVVRDMTSDPSHNAIFGTLDLRRTFTNHTGTTLSRLRFRLIDVATFPAPSGTADLRALSSTDTNVIVDRPPCGSGSSNIVVRGTTLEQPPNQVNGGGFNSSWSVDVSPGLPDGASVDVRFVFGVQQTGYYKMSVLPETLPVGAGALQAFANSYCLDCTDTIFIDQFDF